VGVHQGGGLCQHTIFFFNFLSLKPAYLKKKWTESLDTYYLIAISNIQSLHTKKIEMESHLFLDGLTGAFKLVKYFF